MIFPCERCGWFIESCTCGRAAVVAARRRPVLRLAELAPPPRPRRRPAAPALSPVVAQEIVTAALARWDRFERKTA